MRELDGRGMPLSAIHWNARDRSVSFEAEGETVAKLTLSATGIVFELPSAGRQEVASEAAPNSNEKEPTVVLTGRLKSTPKEGRPDRSGNPTVWARLAVREEGRSEVHMYIATFHRHTVGIALTLPREAQLTVEGYPHPSQSEKRLDSLSVVNIVNYPGKGKRLDS